MQQRAKRSLPCARPVIRSANRAKDAVGPVLNGVIGRKAGMFPAYAYSDTNKNSGLTWDGPTFREYIRDSRPKVPGTKVIYAGLKDEKKI